MIIDDDISNPPHKKDLDEIVNSVSNQSRVNKFGLGVSSVFPAYLLYRSRAKTRINRPYIGLLLLIRHELFIYKVRTARIIDIMVSVVVLVSKLRLEMLLI